MIYSFASYRSLSLSAVDPIDNLGSPASSLSPLYCRFAPPPPHSNVIEGEKKLCGNFLSKAHVQATVIAVRRRRCCAARPTVSPERRCAVSWRLLGGAHKHTTGRRFYLFSSANKFQSSSFIDNNPRWTVGVCKIDPTVKSSPPQQSNSWASGREQVSPLRYCQTPTPPLAWCLLSRRVSPSSANNGPRLTRVECVVVVCIRVSVSVCPPRERLVTRALFNRTERESPLDRSSNEKRPEGRHLSNRWAREASHSLTLSKTPKAIDTSSKTSC